MQPELTGILLRSGLKFAIVVARFNSFITDRLLAGALDAFAAHRCGRGRPRNRPRAGRLGNAGYRQGPCWRRNATTASSAWAR